VHVTRAGLDARPLEHIAQPHPGPPRIADSASLPLHTGCLGSVKGSSVAAALQHSRDRNFFELSKVAQA